MGKIVQKGVLYINEAAPDKIGFYCPACGEIHWVPKLRWSFNGDYERPTLHPSVIYTSGHYCGHFNPEKDTCWCKYNEEYRKEFPDGPPSPFKCVLCHTWVKEGTIQYLSDCSHAFAGKVVDMHDYQASPLIITGEE
jgi:hypothetical protein